ncbi:ABC transporter ATP-binding protein [Paracoccus sp. SCSIO 75233]|uniref:ABC transporter ATP-binding protein n=1 Tax=Paracoccus sp. SCSIO 75233 TaxID=3017782 RepID=UPI0022F0F946|nr:ABC transporter ATP-binding protein [Paracoccus sp. SCSIO 75233]WBU53219.1 ABC transporter ATP-binding protein [Paracoccus sp. SCSIO 75233]
MLELTDISAGYGPVQVLDGLSLRAEAGQIHTLLGRNGAGKTTTLRRIMGLLTPAGGAIHLDGRDITAWATPRIARAGIAWVPEGREIFGSLSVRENLTLAGRIGKGDWSVQRITDLFPGLAGRLDAPGRALSGGEQQMLAIGRALMTSPRLLLLDEPTEGLAVPLVAALSEALQKLRAEGLTMILVEQNIRFATALADRITLIARGRHVWGGDPDAFAAATDIRRRHLGA